MLCREKRHVSSCKKCCHYKECKYGISGGLTRAEYNLLCDIIRCAVIDLKYAIKKENFNKAKQIATFIKNKADFYTAYNISADYILENVLSNK